LQLFKDLSRSGKTVLVVTHERDIARWATRIIKLADGEIVNEPTLDRLPALEEVAHA
jgi:ABC-type lipoprotein export system ATPase subunit